MPELHNTAEPHLEPVLPDRFAARPGHALICLGVVVLFLYCSHLPLAPTETWRHLKIGNWIVEHGRLPASNPFIELADGMPWSNASWLGQVGLAQLQENVGSEYLSCFVAVCTALGLVGFCFAFRNATDRLGPIGIALALVGLSFVGHLETLSPTVFGFVFYAVLVWRLSHWQNYAIPFADFVFVPLLFCLWSNMDVSSFVGLAVLNLYAIGRCAQAVRDSRSWHALVTNPSGARLVFLSLLCVGSSFVNPAGVENFKQLLTATDNPIWRSLGGTNYLVLPSLPGLLFVAAFLFTAAAWKRSNHGFRVEESLVVGSLVVMVSFNSRWVVWLVPVAMLFALRQFGMLKRAAPSSAGATASRPLKFTYSLVCVLLVWIGFSLSPISTPLLGGNDRTKNQVYGSPTPRVIAERLDSFSPSNAVWAPAYWADWLLWQSAPPGGLMTDSSVTQLPVQAQRDYAAIYRGEANWQRLADRYDIGTIVIDKRRQRRLAAVALRGDSRWRLVYEDGNALIVTNEERDA